MSGSKISNAPEQDSFAAAFMLLKLGREVRKITGRTGESKMGTGLQDS